MNIRPNVKIAWDSFDPREAAAYVAAKRLADKWAGRRVPDYMLPERATLDALLACA